MEYTTSAEFVRAYFSTAAQSVISISANPCNHERRGMAWRAHGEHALAQVAAAHNRIELAGAGAENQGGLRHVWSLRTRGGLAL